MIYVCIRSLITVTARKYPNASIYCAGDFNLPDIDWSSESKATHRSDQSTGT